MTEIRIEGVITATVDPDTFTDEFLDWLESRGWMFGGGIGPYYENEDNDDNNG